MALYHANTDEEIDALRAGGKILAQIFHDLREYTHAGLSKREINDWVAAQIKSHGAYPTYYDLRDPSYPGAICISVNDEIVHGVPDDYVLEKDDIVSYDLVITYRDMKTDSAFTMVVDDKPSGSIKHLLATTERSLYAGIDAVKGRGAKTGDIGEAVEKVLKAGNLGIIRDLVGHGVGLEMHMSPDVPNYGHKGRGSLLIPRQSIAIEPMATLGGEDIVEDPDDGWTIRSSDGSLSAHFEHSILVTESGAEILTQL